jgi:hypothetical protein
MAEAALVKIAIELKKRGATARDLFADFTSEAEIEGEPIGVLAPMDFVEGLMTLGTEFNEVEVQCLLSILSKPQLENFILLEEIEKIIENFDLDDEDVLAMA